MTNEVNVNINDDLKCFGLHYQIDLDKAKKHFEDEGFQGISNFNLLYPIGCNDGRKKVIAIAKRQEAKWYFRGEWDYSAAGCGIYEFSYKGFVGELQNGDEDTWGNFAGWSGHQ